MNELLSPRGSLKTLSHIQDWQDIQQEWQHIRRRTSLHTCGDNYLLAIQVVCNRRGWQKLLWRKATCTINKAYETTKTSWRAWACRGTVEICPWHIHPWITSRVQWLDNKWGSTTWLAQNTFQNAAKKKKIKNSSRLSAHCKHTIIWQSICINGCGMSHENMGWNVRFSTIDICLLHHEFPSGTMGTSNAVLATSETSSNEFDK